MTKSTAFEIGYNAFKNGDACVPCVNEDLREMQRQSANDTEYSFNLHQFAAGVNKASKEWEEEFFANAE